MPAHLSRLVTDAAMERGMPPFQFLEHGVQVARRKRELGGARATIAQRPRNVNGNRARIHYVRQTYVDPRTRQQFYEASWRGFPIPGIRLQRDKFQNPNSKLQ